jgi:hypothetical protein
MNVNETDQVPAKGPKYLAVLSSLPEQLRPVYKALVEEYKFHALARYGRAWVAYDVIADLVRSGWRPEPSLLSNDQSTAPGRAEADAKPETPDRRGSK